ncbi:MAG: hypothetical protein AB7T63_00565 [Planctomycetota bacterium]
MGSLFMRSSRVVAACGLAALLVATDVAAEEPAPAPEPPVVTYGGSRRSTGWVTLPGGARAAIDRGATWRGVTAYITLTYDLVGVDAESHATLFASNIGAFWTTLTFAEVTLEDGTKQWAIELRPDDKRQLGGDRRQYHALRTGERLDVPAARAREPGTPIPGVVAASGDRSHIADRFALLIGTPDGWRAASHRLFGDDVDRPALGDIDFAKQVVVLVSFGNSSNCRGIVLQGAYEADARVTLRIDASTFQTMDGWQKVRPWGVFVVPRREGKVYVIEDDAQRLIAGPPLWVERWRFEGIPAPDKELAGLPAATTEAWHGWAQPDEHTPRRPPPPPKSPPR